MSNFINPRAKLFYHFDRLAAIKAGQTPPPVKWTITLWDMTPTLATDNHGDGRTGYTESPTKLADFLFARGVQLTNLSDSGFGEFRHAMRRASILAIFGHFIRGVVGVCADKQVGRVYAAAIIALMENMKCWQYAKMDFIRNAMRPCCFAVPACFAITSFVESRSPFPAVVGATLVNMIPEKLLDGRASIVPLDETNGLSLNMARSFVVIFCNRCGLTATAFTKFLGWMARGIMGSHKNLRFLCQAQGVHSVAGHSVLVATPVIIARVSA